VTSRPGCCAVASRGARSWSGVARGRANQIHAIAIRNLKGRALASDTFGKNGRAWLATLELPVDEREMLDSCPREADFLTAELALVDRQIARYALSCAQIRRLMTIPASASRPPRR
jgi:hypothetical protein